MNVMGAFRLKRKKKREREREREREGNDLGHCPKSRRKEKRDFANQGF